MEVQMSDSIDALPSIIDVENETDPVHPETESTRQTIEVLPHDDVGSRDVSNTIQNPINLFICCKYRRGNWLSRKQAG